MPEPIEDHVELADLPQEDRLARMRHSAAHVLAEAMVELMPEAELGIGPPTATGFYYDFRLPRALTQEDLTWLRRRMRKSVGRRLPFEMASITRDEAAERWADQPFKLDLLADLEDGAITQCTHGQFTDLCRGGHVNHTGEIPAFKLMSIAGAYWRGDENNPQLQRVYGALFETREELDEYERQLEEARKRDHRRVGRELGLFTFSDVVGQGIPLFLPKGETVRHLMEGYVRELQERAGHQHVWTANVVKSQLYERSGHREHYADAMFPPMVDGETEFLLKPMNCPSHMTLFNAEPHSYRDLPLRYAEFATLYRYEKSGELNGLTRVRSLTQDDIHVFCTPDQIQEEFALALSLVREALDTYGLSDYRVALSLPDTGGDGKFVDAPEQWEQAVTALRSAMEASGLEFAEEEGEAAFYGPKADFIAKDVLGREWQLSTIQVDFIQPGAPWLRLYRRGREGAHPRDAPPGRHGRDRALPGRAHRALRRRLPPLAGARAGGDHPHRRPPPALRRRGRGHPAQGRVPRGGGRPQRAHEREDSPRHAAEDPLHARRRRPRGGGGNGRGARAHR